MAAPHVAATAALIIASGVLGRHPTPAQITARLRATARKLGGGGDERLYGAGLVDAAAATAPGGPGAIFAIVGALRARSDSHGPAAPHRCDLAVVGGGIVGLAVARELLAPAPEASVCVLEREREVATHQTGHNSGVIHAGIYYAPGSLKARLCVEGARELYEYCAERGHRKRALRQADRGDRPIRACPPATSSSAGPRPTAFAACDGSTPHGVRRARAARARDRRAALARTPAIVDFPAVARAYAADCATRAERSRRAARSSASKQADGALRLAHARGATEAGHAIFCAGAWADRLAVAAGADPDPRIVPFRGAYLRLVPERRDLVRSLIYPVPDPSLPFLGVHLTRHIDGDVLIGPTALLAGARDAYRLGRVRRADLIDTLAWPGTWRMSRRLWPPA